MYKMSSFTILQKARRGKEILEKVKSDGGIFLPENEKQISAVLFDLLHYQCVARARKALFVEGIEDRYSDGDYLRIADLCKNSHDDLIDSDFTGVIDQLCITKAGGNPIKALQILNVCQHIVCQEWIGAGLVRP